MMNIFANVPKVQHFIFFIFSLFELVMSVNPLLSFAILQAPADPILGLVARFKACPSEKKAWPMFFSSAVDKT